MLSQKKPQVYEKQKLKLILQQAGTRGVLAKVSSENFQFNGVFLETDEQGMVLDNRLMHLDDVRRLKNQELQLFFPYRKTLLKGTVRLIGLTTFRNIRALRFTLPKRLVTDEKRGVKRISALPDHCRISFHTQDLHIFRARIHDASPSGFALILNETTPMDDLHLVKGKRFPAEVNLDSDLKLSINIEIRHVTTLTDVQTSPAAYKIGVKTVKLTQEAQVRLNNWLLQCNVREQETRENDDAAPKATGLTAPAKPKQPNSILVIGPDSIDLDFWYQCLGRKYEVITSDDNIANIRDALNTAPSLLLVFVDAENPDKASFTRKFCSTLHNRFPLMFFGNEPDPKKQATLTGQVPNRGFLDISERKILLKFRHVDDVMSELKSP